MLGVKRGPLRSLWLEGPQDGLPAALTLVGYVPGRGSMKSPQRDSRGEESLLRRLVLARGFA